MNILITGGAGYIGAELVNKLTQSTEIEKVTVYDNLAGRNYNFFTSYKFSPKVNFISGDLLDSRKLRASLKGTDVVFHLAALTDKNPALDSHMFEQVNHWGTSELMNAIEESDVSTVIYLSSTAVYGGGSEVYDENSEPNPKTFYAVSKLRGEEQVKRLFDKKKCFIIRAGNVYGYAPTLRFDGAINKFMFDSNFKGRIQIHGNGRQFRSYIHIDRVVFALTRLINSNIESGIYTLTDKNLQVLDIVEVLQEIYPKLEFIFINQHLKIEDLQVSSEGKITEILNWPASKLKDDLLEFKSKFSF